MLKRFAGAGFAWLALSSSAVAHPGHGHGGGDFSPAHYLGEPVHALFAIPVVLLVALTLAYALRVLRRKGTEGLERSDRRR